ncbi:MAG TPA: hypothetical protein DD490_03915 [Acidobacteria bacterium]|nr:hypothetical protein [Acidobacteriota bacterium]
MGEIPVQDANNPVVPQSICAKSVVHTTGHFDTILKAKFRSALVVVTYECHDNANFTRSDLLFLSVIGKGFANCKAFKIAEVGGGTGADGDIANVEYQFAADDAHLNATLKAKVTRIKSTGAGNCTVAGFLTALG